MTSDGFFTGLILTGPTENSCHSIRLRRLSFPNCRGVLTAGIQELRDDFSSYWIDEAHCADGLKHLGLYRKEWNDRPWLLARHAAPGWPPARRRRAAAEGPGLRSAQATEDYGDVGEESLRWRSRHAKNSHS